MRFVPGSSRWRIEESRRCRHLEGFAGRVARFELFDGVLQTVSEQVVAELGFGVVARRSPHGSIVVALFKQLSERCGDFADVVGVVDDPAGFAMGDGFC